MPRSRTAARLERLEETLSPRRLVALWLQERMAFASAADYAAWLAEQPLGTTVLDRVMQGCASGGGDTTRPSGGMSAGTTSQDVLFHTVFRIQLALRIDEAVAEEVQLESLVFVKLTWQLRALMAEWSLWLDRGREEDLPDIIVSRTSWIDALREHVLTLQLADAARSRLEGRYLDGHQAVFPHTLVGLERIIDLASTMASQSSALTGPPVTEDAGAAGAAAIDLEDIRDQARAGASARANDIVLAARVATHDVLDDPYGALDDLAAAVDGARDPTPSRDP